MKRTALPLAIAAMLTAMPALAQQSPAYTGQGAGMDQTALAPVQDVVTAVEQRLNQLGYDTQVDGQFDADLRNSVMLFQSDAGLRPTGNVDLSTIAALGLDVDPSGRAAQSAMTTTTPQAQVQDQTAVIVVEPQVSAITDDDSADYPLLRDEKMSAPVESFEEGSRIENFAGIPVPEAVTNQGDIPGIEPGFFEENLR